jgi:hypothetical protein
MATVYAVDFTTGDVCDIEIACPLLQKARYSTSFIPTTTAALSRNGDVITGLTANNCTAEQETIMIQFAPRGSNFANDGAIRNIADTNTIHRRIRKESGGTVVSFFPNSDESSSCNPQGTTSILVNTIYVIATVAYGPTATTNAEIYINGISEKTDTDNYTIPAWGANFYIGSNSGGASQLNGIVQRYARWNRALTAGEILMVKNIWSQN